MKSSVIYSFALILSAVFVSCDKKWYEVQSDKSISVFTSLTDMELLLNSSERLNRNTPALGEISSDGHYITEAVWSSSSSSLAGDINQRNAYTWSEKLPYQQLGDWTKPYANIFTSNFVLEGLRKINPATNEELLTYNKIKGNALFHRAKNHFDLSQIFSLQFVKGQQNSGLGIPVKLNTDVTELTPRSTVSDTYHQILKDLFLALDLLPLRSQKAVIGSKLACMALLSRIYLVMQEYKEAAKWSDSCLKYESSLLDLNTFPSNNPNLGIFNKEVIFHSTISTDYQFITSSARVSQDLYDSYRVHDLRKSRYFTENSNGTISFKGVYNNSSRTHFSGLATNEIYLVRAECFARAGDIINAMKLLNDLLITRWDSNITYEPVVASNADEALRLVLKEREKELMFRGIRWSDLRRLNLEEATKVNIIRTIGGETYTLEPKSYKYTFPIPKDVRDLAPEISQTPGWGN